MSTSTRDAEVAVLKTLVYFDIFDYPLTAGEIKEFLVLNLSDAQFVDTIDQLIAEKIIFKIGEFYSLQNNIQKAEKRTRGNTRAQTLLAKAKKIASFLHRFPYVRAVGVSGSLSKNYADQKADIDFFIITRANRLWIARTILHLFKKLTFLVGRQHFYCMNYFIDEQALAIPERNVYTAVEVVTLLPLAGKKAMVEFFEANEWTLDWLPNYPSRLNAAIPERSSIFKSTIEWLFKNRLGDQLDNYLFSWTAKRWTKKEHKGQKNSKGKVMNLVTGKHFSKSDPEAFQQKILSVYENKISTLDACWGAKQSSHLNFFVKK